MTLTTCNPDAPPGGDRSSGSGAGIVELSLLLPRDHLSGLERAAGAEGITVARLLRRVIREYLDREHGRPPRE